MARWKPSVAPVVVPDDAATLAYKCRRVLWLVTDIELVSRFTLGRADMRARLDEIIRDVVGEHPDLSYSGLAVIARERALKTFGSIASL